MSSREIQEAKGFGDRSKIQERLNEVTKEMIGLVWALYTTNTNYRFIEKY